MLSVNSFMNMNACESDGISECQVKLRKKLINSYRPGIISELLSIPPSSLNSPSLKPIVFNAYQNLDESIDSQAKFKKVRDSDLICLSSSDDEFNIDPFRPQKKREFDEHDENLAINNIQNSFFFDNDQNFLNVVNDEGIKRHGNQNENINYLKADIEIFIKQNSTNNCANDTKEFTDLNDVFNIKKSSNLQKRRVELKDGKINIYNISNTQQNSPNNLYRCFKKNSTMPLFTIYCARIFSIESHRYPNGKYHLTLVTKPPDALSLTLAYDGPTPRDEWMAAIVGMVRQFHVIPQDLGTPAGTAVDRVGYVYLKNNLIGDWNLGVACLSDRRIWYWNVRDGRTLSRDLRTALRLVVKRSALSSESADGTVKALTSIGYHPNVADTCSKPFRSQLKSGFRRGHEEEHDDADQCLENVDASSSQASINPTTQVVIDFPPLQATGPFSPSLYICTDLESQTGLWARALKYAVYQNGPGLSEQRLLLLPAPPSAIETPNFESGVKGEKGVDGSSVTSDRNVVRDRGIPVVVDRLINFVTDYGCETRGIYRLNGSQVKIEALLKSLMISCSDAHKCHVDEWSSADDPKAVVLTRDNYSEHDGANALKRYLRNLPEALIVENLLARLKNICFESPTQLALDKRFRAYGSVLKDGLPPINYATLRRLLGHLYHVSLNEARNHMNAQNLGSVIGPGIMAPRNDKCPEFQDYADTNWYILVVTDLITHYPAIFQVSHGELEAEKKIREGLHKMSLAKSAASSRAGEFLVAIYFDQEQLTNDPIQSKLNSCSISDLNHLTKMTTSQGTELNSNNIKCFVTKVSSTLTVGELKAKALHHFTTSRDGRTLEEAAIVVGDSVSSCSSSTSSFPFIDNCDPGGGSRCQSPHVNHDSPPANHSDRRYEKVDGKADFKARLNDLLQLGPGEHRSPKAEPRFEPPVISGGDRWCILECVRGGQLVRPVADSEAVLGDVLLSWTYKFFSTNHGTDGKNRFASIGSNIKNDRLSRKFVSSPIKKNGKNGGAHEETNQSSPDLSGCPFSEDGIEGAPITSINDRNFGVNGGGRKRFSFGKRPRSAKGGDVARRDCAQMGVSIPMSTSLIGYDSTNDEVTSRWVPLNHEPSKTSSADDDVACQGTNRGGESQHEELVVIKLTKDPWIVSIDKMGMLPFSVCAELKMAGIDKKKITTFKKYCFEFSRSTLSYYKSSKAGTTALGEFSISDISLYQGIEAHRSPPSQLGFTFFHLPQLASSKSNQPEVSSYSILCNSKEEFVLWINVLFKAKYYP